MKNFITQAKPQGFYGMKATTLTRWCFGLVFLLTGLSSYGQVATNRIFGSTTGTYTPITGGTVLVTQTNTTTSNAGSLDDGAVYTVTLPFSFTYDGAAYTEMTVTNNMSVSFGGTAMGSGLYTPLSSTGGTGTTAAAYAAAISVYGRDMQGGYIFGGTSTTGSPILTLGAGASTAGVTVGSTISGTGIPAATTVIAVGATTVTMSANATSNSTNSARWVWNGEMRHETLGSPGNQIFVVQWSNMKPFGTTLTTTNGFRMNAQLRIHEQGNKIEIVYGPCTPGVATSTSTAQVGLRGPNSTFATNVNNRLVTKNVHDWATSAAGTANTSGLVFNNVAPANVIPSGLTYSWSEPTTDAMDWNNIQWLTDGSTGSNTSYSALAGTPLTAYAQGYEAGVTEAAGVGTGVEAWIGTSSTNDNPANVGWTWTAATFGNQVGNNDEFQANLPPLAPGTYYVASRWRLNNGPFTYGGYNGPWNGTGNNSIELILTPNPTQCATPLLPADAATGVAYPVANLSWSAPTTGPTPTGYQVWFGTDPAALTNIGTATTTNVNITGLTANTVYHWQIIPTSTVGGTATGCVVRSFTTQLSPFNPYCEVPAFTSAIEPITLVDFAGINNTLPNTVLTAANGGISHVNNIPVSGNVTMGQSYAMTLKGNTDGNFTNNFRVFIDWNQDGDFADPGETFNAGTILNSTGLDAIQALSNIAVPMTALPGATRMRVKKLFGTTNLENPCLSGGFGQIHDYTLNVQAPVTQITQLFFSQCSLVLPANEPTVVLNAFPVENATNYEFQVTVNNGNPQSINTANSFMTFAQLSALPGTGATIAVKVRATVNGIVGEWGNTCILNTATQITQLLFSQCSMTLPANEPTVVLNAFPVDNASSYDFMVTVNGGTPQMINTVNSYFTFGQLTNLPGHSASIAVSVRAIVNGVAGAWGNTCTVTTNAPGDEDFVESIASKQEMAAYPNPFTNQFTLKLANNSEAAIQIFDINGRLVANQVVNDSYDVELGQNLTSGVYLVRVEQNNELKSFKMIKK
jgi:hypothetical protein